MSAFTDRLYLEWARKNGEVLMLASRPARRRGYGGTPPWERSETVPALSRSHTSANPAGLAPDAGNGVKASIASPCAPC